MLPNQKSKSPLSFVLPLSPFLIADQIMEKKKYQENQDYWAHIS